MRKIKSHFFISLDGVVESPDKWHFPYFDDEVGAAVSAGFTTTDAWLLREGLLDELNLLVHPIVVGDGLARLFRPDEPRTPLALRSAQTFQSGVLNLSYAPAQD